ncbi:hypothetical protein ACOMHN_053107 [Nucella lapillus]
MSNRCCVYGCNIPQDHAFPRDPTLRKQWIQLVKREKTFEPTKNSIVCTSHFRKEDYCDGPTYDGSVVRKRLWLKRDAVPTVFSWSRPTNHQANWKRKERREQRGATKRETLNPVIVKEVQCLPTGRTAGDQQNQDMEITEPQTCSTEIQACLDHPPLLSAEGLEFDKALLHYYTGLESYEKFEAVFQSL